MAASARTWDDYQNTALLFNTDTVFEQRKLKKIFCVCVIYPQMSVPSFRSAAVSLDYTSPGCYLATSSVLGSLAPILQGIEYGLLLLFSEHPKVGLCLNENFGITTAYN